MSVRANEGISVPPELTGTCRRCDGQVPETSPDRVIVIALARTQDLVSGSKD